MPRPSGTCATPSRVTFSVAIPVRSLPRKAIRPPVRTIPQIDRSVVVLPAPFGPSSATT